MAHTKCYPNQTDRNIINRALLKVSVSALYFQVAECEKRVICWKQIEIETTTTITHVYCCLQCAYQILSQLEG